VAAAAAAASRRRRRRRCVDGGERVVRREAILVRERETCALERLLVRQAGSKQNLKARARV
jgi:hypothetical protein